MIPRRLIIFVLVDIILTLEHVNKHVKSSAKCVSYDVHAILLDSNQISVPFLVQWHLKKSCHLWRKRVQPKSIAEQQTKKRFFSLSKIGQPYFAACLASGAFVLVVLQNMTNLPNTTTEHTQCAVKWWRLILCSLVFCITPRLEWCAHVWHLSLVCSHCPHGLLHTLVDIVHHGRRAKCANSRVRIMCAATSMNQART